MYLKNALKHIKLVHNHRWLVFKLCCKIGEPWRGFMHDWSKYSPTEFFESIKYYNGDHSPINECKKDKGYSEAWLHHKGRNKHHSQYWEDPTSPVKAAMIPYKYAAEMICDKLAAGMTYKGKEFTPQYELDYWMKEKEQNNIHPKTEQFVTEILTQCVEKGIDKTLNKKNLKNIYKKYCK